MNDTINFLVANGVINSISKNVIIDSIEILDRFHIDDYKEVIEDIFKDGIERENYTDIILEELRSQLDILLTMFGLEHNSYIFEKVDIINGIIKLNKVDDEYKEYILNGIIEEDINTSIRTILEEFVDYHLALENIEVKNSELFIKLVKMLSNNVIDEMLENKTYIKYMLKQQYPLHLIKTTIFKNTIEYTTLKYGYDIFKVMKALQEKGYEKEELINAEEHLLKLYKGYKNEQRNNLKAN